MDFSFSESEQALYDGALAFARSQSATGADAGVPPEPSRALVDRSRWLACAEFGLTGLSVPPELGGLGLTALATARVVEAFGRGGDDGGLLFSACAHLFAVTMPIVDHASAALRAEVVPELASGRRIGANAITEPGAGSDTSALATRAVRDGEGYRISGDKSYVTNGPVADEYLVYATTNARAGYLGQTAFLVPRDTPGLTVSKPFAKTGLPGSPIGTVHLGDCYVPTSRRVGREGQGARIFARSMAWERACLFAAFVGAMDASLDRCVDYACAREQRGRPIVSHQAVSHRLAEMKRRLESARLLLYRACWAHDQGMDATLDISLAKLAVSEAALESGIDAIRVHGGLGYMKESGADRALLDALGSTIFSGTSDIQRELIVRELVASADRDRRARGRSAAA